MKMACATCGRFFPAALEPERITAVIDTREQIPLCLHPLKAVTQTLTTGDYSVLGLEEVISVERKSLPDLLHCVGRDRRRFEKEIQRLLAYPSRALVLETSWEQIEQGVWKSKVRPQAVVGSVIGWCSRGLPVILAGTHTKASQYTVHFLLLAARRRWREARSLAGALT
jgi:DNA excision repair protein ERCC-4